MFAFFNAPTPSSPDNSFDELSSFPDRVNFVKYVLAGATDAQLDFARILPVERDNFLKKELVVKPFESYETKGSLYKSGACGSFDVLESDKEKLVIKFHKHITLRRYHDHAYDTAAHEILHITRFCNEDKKSYGVKFALGAMTSFVTGVMGCAVSSEISGTVLSSILLSSAYTLRAGYRMAEQMKKEEFDAFRFGNLFNPLCYQGKKHSAPEHRYDNARQVLRFYPSNTEIVQIYNQTCDECTNGNVLFPSGIASMREKHADYTASKLSI